jgi:threonine dehydrogenase-like Zn-dependent dehydrogenase
MYGDRRREDGSMKAVAKLQPVPGAMALIDIDTPTRRGDDEALVRIAAAGICGTDVSLWHWQESIGAAYAPQFPLILGHEFAGIVEDCADNARVRPGDVVAVYPQLTCGHCAYCARGRHALCDARRIMGCHVDGGWTEFMSLPLNNLFPLPAGTDPAVAPLLEPLAVCIRAVHEQAPVRPGDVVAVIGAGPIGLITAILARAAGAALVFVSGLEADAGRLQLAEQLGAKPVNIGRQPFAEAIRAQAPDGADVVYETSGAAIAFPEAARLVRKAGRVGLIGLCHGEAPFDSLPLVFREIEVIGSRAYNETTWRLMMKLLGPLTPDLLKLISHTLPLGEFAEALRLVEQSEGVKVILRPDSD